MKYIHALILSVIFAFLGCKGINSKTKDVSKNQPNQVGSFQIKDLNINTIQENVDKLKNVKIQQDPSCKDYDPGVPNTSIVSRFWKDSPINDFKNCLAQYIDETLEPLCEMEKELNDLEKEHRDDPDALDQIEEARWIVDDGQDEVIEYIYILVDEVADQEDKISDHIENDVDNDLLGFTLDFLNNSEIGGLRRFLNAKASLTCPSIRLDFSRKRK